MFELLMNYVTEHPDKILNLVLSFLGMFGVVIGKKVMDYVHASISKLDDEKKRIGFNFVSDVAFETVAEVYGKRNEIAGKMLEDGKIGKEDGAILMQYALTAFKAKLISNGKSALANTDAKNLMGILEASYSKFKMLRDTVKDNTEKK